MNNNILEETASDLLYDKAAIPCIKKKWPQLIVNDASDIVHTDRVSIRIPGITMRELYIHALENGYSEILLGFQILLRGSNEESDFIKMVKEWLTSNRV